MQEIALLTSLSLPADAAMRELICAYEEFFPEQIVGYYVEGSYADHSYLATSDIDVTIVFRSGITDKTLREAKQLWSRSSRTSTMELDITVVDEESLRGGMDLLLKLGSLLIYGTDIRGKYSIVSIADWTHQRMHAAYLR
jgi:predicted nucleotidyltransferase